MRDSNFVASRIKRLGSTRSLVTSTWSMKGVSARLELNKQKEVPGSGSTTLITLHVTGDGAFTNYTKMKMKMKMKQLVKLTFVQ